MSYKCSACGTIVSHNRQMLRHTVYRNRTMPNGTERQEIAREQPVCSTCHDALHHMTFKQVVKMARPKIEPVQLPQGKPKPPSLVPVKLKGVVVTPQGKIVKR